MKRVFQVVTIIFMIATFIGAGYVMFYDGRVSPGYAVCPMVLTLSCQGIQRNFEKEKKK